MSEKKSAVAKANINDIGESKKMGTGSLVSVRFPIIAKVVTTMLYVFVFLTWSVAISQTQIFEVFFCFLTL